MMVLILISVSYSRISFADNGVIFVSPLSSNIDYMAAINSAFIGRQWTVVSLEDKSITGRLVHRGVEATLSVYYEGDSLKYTCECLKSYTKKSPAGNKKKKVTKPYIPRKWIENLRQDRGTGDFPS